MAERVKECVYSVLPVVPVADGVWWERAPQGDQLRHQEHSRNQARTPSDTSRPRASLHLYLTSLSLCLSHLFPSDFAYLIDKTSKLCLSAFLASACVILIYVFPSMPVCGLFVSLFHCVLVLTLENVCKSHEAKKYQKKSSKFIFNAKICLDCLNQIITACSEKQMWDLKDAWMKYVCRIDNNLNLFPW